MKKIGKVVLFQHGLISDRFFFQDTVKDLTKNQFFIDGGVITCRNTFNKETSTLIESKTFSHICKNLIYCIRTSRKNTSCPPQILLHNDFDDRFRMLTGMVPNKLTIIEKIKLLTDMGYMVLFRTEFSNPIGSNSEQINELNQFVSELLPPDTPLVLVGHSKGGVINVGYATKKPVNISKIITIGSPFRKSSLAKFLGIPLSYLLHLVPFKNNGIKDLAGSTLSLKKIKQRWNANRLYKKIQLYTVGIDLFGKKIYKGDFVVSLNSQLGVASNSDCELKGARKILIPYFSKIKNSFFHFFHLYEPLNPVIINTLEKLIVKNPKDKIDINTTSTLIKTGTSKECNNFLSTKNNYKYQSIKSLFDDTVDINIKKPSKSHKKFTNEFQI